MMKHVVSTAALALLIALYAAPIGAAGPATIVDAAKAGNIAAVRTFLKQPKAANVASKDGTTALHWATDLDNLSLIHI